MTDLSLPALSRDEVAEVQRRLVADYGMTPLQTLENGGRNLALVAKTLLEGDVMDRAIVVLAGRGNTGAGGLVAARHLLNWGAWVQVVCSHPTSEFAGNAAHALFTLHAMGAPLAWAEEGWELPPCDLVVDALVGVGLRGEPVGKVRDLIQLANSSVAPILSLDLPSGVDAESGVCATPHIRAAATLTMALPKRGLLASGARQACGELYLGDVGVPLSLYAEMGLAVEPCFARDPIVPWDVEDGSARVVEI